MSFDLPHLNRTRSSHTSTIKPVVVIVGGSIAGASLAIALAQAGRQVLVLEASETFRDRVRGESMMPWGVAEARALGVEDILLKAGAHTAKVWKRFTEGSDTARDLPIGLLIPGVSGSLNLHYPVACQALLDAAVQAGATVLRGVEHVSVMPGISPEVSYEHGGVRHRARPELVVGADGGQSIVRRCAGIALEQQEATSCVAGLLLDGVGGPDHFDIVMEHNEGVCLLLFQGKGRARAYQMVPMEHRARYVQGNGAEVFLADATLPGSPLVEALCNAHPAGPCATFLGTDTWTLQPFADGIVLIGDAAGYNDPSVGCGLSIALRDARIVRDLILGGAKRVEDFRPYASERHERMRRLRLIADVVGAATVESSIGRTARRRKFSAAMAHMDPKIAPLVLGMFAGPETIPASLAIDSVLNEVRAL